MSRDTDGAGRSSRGETQAADASAAEERHQELVKSLRRAIDRRDRRIDKLTDSLDQETQRVEKARRELDELHSRVIGLERTLEHRTQTCHRLRELLRDARGGDPADVEAEIDDAAAAAANAPATSGRLERPPRPRALDAAAPWDAAAAATLGDPAAPASGRSDHRVVDIARARARDSGVSSILAEADEPPTRFGESQVIETVPDVASELLSPEVMLDEAERKGPLIGSGSSRRGPGPPEALTDTGAEIEPLGAPTMVLLSLDGDPPQRYPIDRDLVTIGRSRFSDVTIDSRLISRLHARICVEDGRASIEDLGSTNGVKVNSKRVERAELADGDLIHLGRATFRFVVDEGHGAG